MANATLVGTEVFLLFLDGSKYGLEFTQEIINALSRGDDSPTVELLKKYIFENWESISAEKKGSVDGVETVELLDLNQIQLLHLGMRLDNSCELTSLNLELSPVLHVVIKPHDLYLSSMEKGKKFDLKAVIGGGRRKSVSNAGTNPNPNVAGGGARRGSSIVAGMTTNSGSNTAQIGQSGARTSTENPDLLIRPNNESQSRFQEQETNQRSRSPAKVSHSRPTSSSISAADEAQGEEQRSSHGQNSRQVGQEDRAKSGCCLIV
ncbi:unnamed protein product [Kuraishia capsulata CBS 1993]|uniref:Uncharacterized protein n=1 Tax=Kuraishia capsulata CBS 1993 TaxID=1382522 RepID=W6MVC5_9ASCO|nr:uncharacterized protein KUCA_T00002181001 [Kuraishia capsulata CBS 1993]CDK26210.1 unnamed protein product [Kuraishia capsulata CBS 1993]